MQELDNIKFRLTRSYAILNAPLLPDLSRGTGNVPLPDEQPPALPIPDDPFIEDDHKPPDISSGDVLDNRLPNIDLHSDADLAAAFIAS